MRLFCSFGLYRNKLGCFVQGGLYQQQQGLPLHQTMVRGGMGGSGGSGNSPGELSPPGCVDSPHASSFASAPSELEVRSPSCRDRRDATMRVPSSLRIQNEDVIIDEVLSYEEERTRKRRQFGMPVRGFLSFRLSLLLALAHPGGKP